MKYWWVNQGQTFEQEISGGYLWAPKREKDGRRSQFYDNLRIVSPGDLILSYVRQNIIEIGTVEDFAFQSPKPEEFGRLENNWSKEGWLLPVKWQSLDQPVFVPEIFEQVSNMFPQKYSPLEKSGRGAQKAYLAEIDHALFQRLCELGNITVPDTLHANLNLKAEVFKRKSEIEILKSIKENPEITNTERRQLIKSRVGQGIFRSRVLAIEKSCRLTGISNPEFLIASHIKPWRLCYDSSERLDGANGLMLTPSADLLFDRGFVSFEDNGEIIVSSKLEQCDSSALINFGVVQSLRSGFSERQKKYLDFHRENVLLL